MSKIGEPYYVGRLQYVIPDVRSKSFSYAADSVHAYLSSRDANDKVEEVPVSGFGRVYAL